MFPMCMPVDLFFQVFTFFVADSNAETCGNIADVVFVIDSSSSIWINYFHQQLEFVKQMVNTFDIGQNKTRIGALSFSNVIVREFHLKAYDSKQDILNAISEIEYTAGDSTNTFEALRVLRTEHFSEWHGDRSDVPNIAILLTDGGSYNMADTVNEATLTREAGVTLFAIGIGHSVNEEELKEIVSSPKANYMHHLENFTKLQSDAFPKLHRYQACKTLVNESKEEKCTRIVDLMFLIDSSASISEDYFFQQLEFVKQVVNAFDVGQGKTRIGALSFSNTFVTEFSLKEYDSKREILNAIGAIQYTAGDATNTFYALMNLRTDQFSEMNGDRREVPNIAILLTDGVSTNMAETVNEAMLIKEAGVTIYAIGIGSDIKREELEQIASSPHSDHMYILETFTELQSGELAKRLSYQACKACPENYFLYAKSCERLCYRYESSDCQDWSNARKACQAEEGDLLVPSECYYEFFRDQAFQNEGNCDTYFWLGARRSTNEDDFRTVTGETISKKASFWDANEPDNNVGDESCLEMGKDHQYKASDTRCSDTQGYICQKRI